MIAGSLTITVLAFAVDGLLAVIQRLVTPAPLRARLVWGVLGRRVALETA